MKPSIERRFAHFCALWRRHIFSTLCTGLDCDICSGLGATGRRLIQQSPRLRFEILGEERRRAA